MWWSDRSKRALIALFAGHLLVLTAGSCGFRPLYGTDSAGPSPVAQELASIAIPEPKDRLHQLVRNELVRGGLSESEGIARYKLDLKVAEKEQDVLVQRSSLVERRVMQLDAKFALMQGKKQPLFAGENSVQVSYNRTASEFNNIRAQKDARERAAKRLAEIIQTRLAAWLAQNRPAS